MPKLMTQKDYKEMCVRKYRRAHIERARITLDREPHDVYDDFDPVRMYEGPDTTYEYDWVFISFERGSRYYPREFRGLSWPDAERKLKKMHAYILSCYRHSGDLWFLRGDVDLQRWLTPAQRRFDTAQIAGALVPPAYVRRSRRSAAYKRECAREIARDVTNWINGSWWKYVIDFPGVPGGISPDRYFCCREFALDDALETCTELGISRECMEIEKPPRKKDDDDE